MSGIRDVTGQPCQLLSISRDITERKLANEELLASRERLAALSRQLMAAQEA